jgi:hypothetical protein
MKKCFITLLLVTIITLCGLTPGIAQVWKPGNSIDVGWDAVTSPSGTITYNLYYKPVAGGSQTFVAEVSTTQATITIPIEGKFILGVSTKRTVGADSVESSISWSDNPAVTFQAQTFGILYLNPASAPVGIKPLD